MQKNIETAFIVRSLCSNSSLPFLYQTQTLLTLPSNPKCLFKPFKPCFIHRSICSTHQLNKETYRIWRPNENVLGSTSYRRPPPKKSTKPKKSPKSAVPFDDFESPPEALNRPRTTITASEKAVFDRIFNDIERSARKARDPSSAEDQHDLKSDPSEDLSSAFDIAIQAMQRRAELVTESAANPVSDLPDAASVPTGSRAQQLSHGQELDSDYGFYEDKEVRQKCHEHKALVTESLERATGDVQIWDVLEMNAFTLVKQLDVHMKDVEKHREARELEEKRSKVRQAKDKTMENMSNTNIASDERGSAVGNGIESKGTSDSTPENKTILSQSSTSAALPPNTVFSILQTNYSQYLLFALRLLRSHYPTSSYALHVLPTIKRLGSISYVLGASTALYNEILFLQWTQFSDLHGMAELLHEMINQGIETNEVTMVLLQKICEKRRYGLMGKYGPVVKAWWNMRSNNEDWTKVWGVYEMIRNEQRAKGERAVPIDEEEHGGRGDDSSFKYLFAEEQEEHPSPETL